MGARGSSNTPGGGEDGCQGQQHRQWGGRWVPGWLKKCSLTLALWVNRGARVAQKVGFKTRTLGEEGRRRQGVQEVNRSMGEDGRQGAQEVGHRQSIYLPTIEKKDKERRERGNPYSCVS
jgi:hypothetical protein